MGIELYVEIECSAILWVDTGSSITVVSKLKYGVFTSDTNLLHLPTSLLTDNNMCDLDVPFDHQTKHLSSKLASLDAIVNTGY